MEAFQLLNHNCWRFVFRELNGGDLLRSRQVCKQFHRLLDELEFQRKWKLDLVLPLLFPYLESRIHWLDAVSWRDLYSVRLTCKSWRDSVDKFAEKFEPTFFSKPTKFHPMATRLSSFEKIKEFLQVFGKSNQNPFPARTVYISRFREPWDNDPLFQLENGVVGFGLLLTQNYIEKFTNFVECFWRNILKLHLDVNLQFCITDCLFVCNLIKRVTMSLRQLKTFRVSGYNYEYYHGRRVRDGQRMATWIEENELSDLPQLRALEIQGLNQAAENYLVEKYAYQLAHFERKYASPLTPINTQIPLQVELFGNLRKLALELVGIYEDTFEPLRLLKCPLKFMKLDVSCGEEDLVNLNMAKLLQNLKHLPLEDLKIKVNHYVRVAEENLELREYTNETIQTLTLHLFHDDQNYVGEISFNFLQSLRKLETLKLKFETCREGREVNIIHAVDLPEDVKLHEYLARREERADMLYESNVWERVPSLKRLTVKVKWPQSIPMPNWNRRRIENFKATSTFTRGEYEMVRRNRDVLGGIGLINLQ